MYNVQAVFKVSELNGWDVTSLASSEVRIIILYCTQSEASLILEAAEKSGLTSNKYLWIVTQSVIGDPGDRSINRRALPIGMLGRILLKMVGYSQNVSISGIHFEVDMLKVLQPFVSMGLKSFFNAVDTMLHRQESTDQRPQQPQFNFSLNCQGVDSNHRWEGGPQFYR